MHLVESGCDSSDWDENGDGDRIEIHQAHVLCPICAREKGVINQKGINKSDIYIRSKRLVQ